jgi:catechol 2,3-dioxygenase-like lactoylglutathione lyase family enzyme
MAGSGRVGAQLGALLSKVHVLVQGAIMVKCTPSNTRKEPRASTRAAVRIAEGLRALLAVGVIASIVVSSGYASHARDRLSGDVQRVKMIGFTVADADREAAFFTNVLQFEKVGDFRVIGGEYAKMEGVFNANMRIVHLKLGEQLVELTQYVSPPTGRPIPTPSYSNDEWFEHLAIVVNDMDAAYKILQENNVQQISAYPVTIPQSNPGAAGIRAIKFHDPEHHDLELLYFPPGKGEPAWQKPTNKLFLGLSHTAMSVGSTEKGVAFYRDLLGLDVGGVTFNTGETQEVLDDLFNDTCLVTEMVPVSAPPHIEFLDYKTPPGGRPMPADTRANDLWYWQTTLITKDVRAITDRLRKAGVQFVTPDVVSIPREAQDQLGFKKAVIVRDPNGHAIRLIEE